MKRFVRRVLGDPQIQTIKRLRKKVKLVNAFAAEYKKLTDKQLKEKTIEFKKRLEKKGVKLDDLLPEAFAAVREAATRTIGQTHFDVQLIGGMILHEGAIAEMKTGEGKTLVATLPIYLNALQGKGAHFVTVNDYLAQRDAGWMGQIYHALGLSTGAIIADESFIYDPKYTNEEHEDERFRHLKPATRKEAYAADITYGTNNEYGFDYLRDNMVSDPEQLRQRDLHFAIVDEADSILIDEARTPLIISAPASDSNASYSQFSSVVSALKQDEDYVVDEKQRAVTLTDEGAEKVEKVLGLENLYAPENVKLIYHLDQALKAEGLFKKDKDYVVTRDGEVIIVDEFTGRLMHGRRYNEGLHQAIEAKEHVKVQEESMTLATISFQNYFRLYNKLSGMTGTASTESEEFHQIYKLDVVEVPTNKPIARIDKTDKIYKTEAGKFKAIVETVRELHHKGQPVLIGTVSIEKNELLGKMLKKAGIPYEVLNAKNNEREAGIVARAGEKGAVTLATNIAGRGTDIVLAKGVVDLGGLFVLGSERHESRRIDNQLRGRSGRQGDPGMTQFFVSCEDDLMRIFAGERISALMDRLGVDDDTPIENRAVSRALEAAQKKVEGFNFDIRKNVVQYDDVMNRHRKATYTRRRELLLKADISNVITDMIKDEAKFVARLDHRDKLELKAEIHALIPMSDKQLDKVIAAKTFFERQDIIERAAVRLYKDQLKIFTEDIFHQVERDIYLQVLDTLWMQHLENMQHLREGINWRSVGQRDPLVEYRREGQNLFDTMQDNIRHEVVRGVLHAEPTVRVTDELKDTELTRAAKGSVDNADKVIEADHTAEFLNEDTDQSKPAKSPAATKAHKGKTAKRKSRKNQRQNRKRR